MSGGPVGPNYSGRYLPPRIGRAPPDYYGPAVYALPTAYTAGAVLSALPGITLRSEPRRSVRPGNRPPSRVHVVGSANRSVIAERG